MSTIKSVYLQHLNGTTPNATMDTNGNFTVGGTVSGASSNMFRNRINNGDMRIDQRNAGAAFGTSINGYGLDRWNIVQTVSGKFNGGQNYNSITPPPGFTNYMGFTSQSAYTPSSSDQFGIQQWIEGYNIADLNFGTSNAKTVTVSFWVRSSLTGSFSGAIAGYDGSNFRSYSFSYTINSANTWEYKTITIPGDTTTFSYNTGNSYGLLFSIDLGTGSTYKASSPNTWATAATYRGVTGSVNFISTSGATFYITGIQIEAGSVATPFEFIQYGTELALCQRYYQTTYDPGTAIGTATRTGLVGGTTATYTGTWYGINGSFNLPVPMRATPTVSYWDGAGNSGKYSYLINSSWTDNQNTVGTYANITLTSRSVLYSGLSGSAPWSIYVHYAASADI